MPKSKCHRKECLRTCSDFELFFGRKRIPRVEGYRLCSQSCFEACIKGDLTSRWNRLQADIHRRIPRPKLGSILLQTEFITPDQLDAAVSLQQQRQEGRLGEWLRRLGYVEERHITLALSQQYGLPLIHLDNVRPMTDAVKMVPGRVAKCSHLLPVGYDDDRAALRVAVSGPVDFSSQEAIRRMVRRGLTAYIGDQSSIQSLIEKWYGPEELDMSTVPSYGNLEEFLEIGETVVGAALSERADNVQMELTEEFFWARLDFGSASKHHFYRRQAPAVPIPKWIPQTEWAASSIAAN